MGAADWHTTKHDAGTCAMFDVCGVRKDLDDLNCPANIPASFPDAIAAAKLPTLCPTLWSTAGASTLTCCRLEHHTTVPLIRATASNTIRTPYCA